MAQAPRLHARSGLIASALYLRLREVWCLKSLVSIIKQQTRRAADTQASRASVGRGEAPADARKYRAWLGRAGGVGTVRARAALSLPHRGRFPRHETLAGEGCAAPLPGSPLPRGQPHSSAHNPWLRQGKVWPVPSPSLRWEVRMLPAATVQMNAAELGTTRAADRDGKGIQ